jgi:uncharacterized protein YbjT (DUF2867 family)
MLLVTGGTGFVGRHIVARLVRAGEPVRVLARSAAEVPGAEMVPGDVTDPDSALAAARGCRAVIHLVGIIRETRGVTFHAAHVEATRTVVEACQRAGITRLLHMSALGSRPDARSRYHQTKWEAEELVRASRLAATIFRPSVMFGAGNSFLSEVRGLLHRGPFIPIIGSGKALLQPIWIEDTVSCFVGALARPETAGQAYELGGPERMTLEELVDILAEAEGIRKPKLHLPVALMRAAARIGTALGPRFPLTPDQLIMLLEDNVCDIQPMREAFGIEPAPLRGHLRD